MADPADLLLGVANPLAEADQHGVLIIPSGNGLLGRGDPGITQGHGIPRHDPSGPDLG
jgi:hypothetical protein